MTKETIKNSLDLEKILNFIGENRHKIQTIALSTIIVILLALIGYLSYRSYENYNTINEKITKIEVVKDKNIISIIEDNNLRSVDTVTKTANFMYGKKYTNISVAKDILKSMFKIDDGERYGKILKISLLKDIKNKDVDIEMLIDNIDNDDEMISLFGEDIYVPVARKNFKEVYKSNLVRGYISTFPKVKLSDKNLSNILSKLYIYELPFIEEELENTYKSYDSKLEKYQAPYNNFLKNIFFPSVNIWQNKFSDKINADLFGGDYLKNAKYIDINLISYWTNFFKYAYSGKNYKGKVNEIQDISIGKFKEQNIKGVKDVVSLPVNVKFGVKSDSSFYGLISKLTSTSNVKNVMLISEFTYNLWENIKSIINERISNLDENYKKLPLGSKYMVSVLNLCEKGKISCGNLFACEKCKTSKIAKIIKDSDYENSLTGAYEYISGKFAKTSFYDKSSFNNYFKNSYYEIDDMDKLIGARLTDCINGGYCDDILTKKINGDVVMKTIEDFAGCEENSISKCLSNPRNEACNICRYKFANKFDTNYFTVYTLINNINNTQRYSFIDRLKDVYINIPGLLKLGSFKFAKVNNPLYVYDASVNLDIYYRFLSNKELGEILTYIGKERCSAVTNGKAWSITIAQKYINNKINNLYNIDLGADEVYNLKVLQNLISEKNSRYKKADNMEKLLSSLQIYRIFLERGYCENR